MHNQEIITVKQLKTKNKLIRQFHFRMNGGGIGEDSSQNHTDLKPKACCSGGFVSQVQESSASGSPNNDNQNNLPKACGVLNGGGGFVYQVRGSSASEISNNISLSNSQYKKDSGGSVYAIQGSSICGISNYPQHPKTCSKLYGSGGILYSGHSSSASESSNSDNPNYLQQLNTFGAQYGGGSFLHPGQGSSASRSLYSDSPSNLQHSKTSGILNGGVIGKRQNSRHLKSKN